MSEIDISLCKTTFILLSLAKTVYIWYNLSDTLLWGESFGRKGGRHTSDEKNASLRCRYLSGAAGRNGFPHPLYRLRPRGNASPLEMREEYQKDPESKRP